MNFEPIFLGVESLRTFTQRVFEGLGVSEEDAWIAADVLMEADLRGFDCHGVSRLFPSYNRIRKGLIETKPNIDITWVTPTTGCCDGGNGLGMVVGYRAMKACVSRAEEFGAAFLAVSRSNHFGIAGYYSSLALAENMIGITMSNASPRVVPTGEQRESWEPTRSVWLSREGRSLPSFWIWRQARYLAENSTWRYGKG